MKSLRLACAMISCPVSTAFACWQTEIPRAGLHANFLNLRVTDGNAGNGTNFELHAAITFDVKEARSTGAFEKKGLKFATTDSHGLLSFGQVTRGRYWVVPEGSTLGDSIGVEVTSPVAGTRSEYGRPITPTDVSTLTWRMPLGAELTPGH